MSKTLWTFMTLTYFFTNTKDCPQFPSPQGASSILCAGLQRVSLVYILHKMLFTRFFFFLVYFKSFIASAPYLLFNNVVRFDMTHKCTMLIIHGNAQCGSILNCELIYCMSKCCLIFYNRFGMAASCNDCYFF